MIEAIAWGVVIGGLFVLVAGVRRLPWRYCGLIGLGYGLVFTALRLSPPEVEPGFPVVLAALGGAIAAVGHERGERARARRSAAILGSPPAALS